MRTLWLLISICVWAANLGACSSYRAPALSVAAARVTDSSPEGLALAFTIDAENSNTEALPLREVRYSLDLEGKRVFSGVRSAESTLRRLGTQQLTLPAAVPTSALTRLAASGPVSYRLRATITYITPGALAEVLFDTGFRRPKVSFSSTGTIDLAPRPTPGAPTVPATSAIPQN
jgi:hypothetical protein